MHARLRAAALVLAVSSVVAPALASELEPGTWEDTETGTENGRPIKPRVSTECMTREEAKEPLKELIAGLQAAHAECAKAQIKSSGNTAQVTIVCGQSKDSRVDIAFTVQFIDRKNTVSTNKSTIVLGGQKTVSELKTVSRWVSAKCAK
jgi:hypothetical protein